MPGSAVQRLDAKPGIVGQRRLAGRPRRRLRLDRRVVPERHARLLRLGEVQLRRADRLDAVRREQLADLPKLAGVMGRRHDPSGKPAPGWVGSVNRH